MSILIFLLVLFILVLVHELGHFAVAKWMGMRVDEFGIGFPPKLFGIKKGETEYTFNLFPIGGFVKIWGEDGVGDPSARLAENLSERSDGESPASGQPRYEEDGVVDLSARLAESTTVNRSTDRSFMSKSKWAQSAVLVAGVTMNVLFAWVLVAIAFGVGVQSSVMEADATESARLTITNVLPSGPAGKAEIPSGAVIQEVTSNGETLASFTPSAFSSFVESHAESELTMLYTHGGELRMVQITPERGVITEDTSKPAIGVALTLVDTVSRSFFESITDSFMYVVSGLRDITLGIGKLAFEALQFKADFSQVAGPVGIVGLVGEASAYGLTSLLMFTAFISLNLAVINILPFPALDGGRLLLVIIEAVKGTPIRPQFVGALNTIGFLLLILLMVAVTWNDIARLI